MSTRDYQIQDFKRRFEHMEGDIPASITALARSTVAFQGGEFDETGFLAIRAQSTSLERDGSHFIAACYYYLVSLGCPGKACDLVIFLTSLGDGSTEKVIEITDVVLAEGMNLTDRTIREKRKALKAWMKRENYSVLGIEEGEYDYKTKKNAPTKYTAVISPTAAKIVLMARNGSLWKRGDARSQRKAIHEAAVETVWETPEAPIPVKERKKAKEKSPDKEIRAKRKTILTLFQKCLRLEFKRSNGDAQLLWDELRMDMTEMCREEIESLGGDF